ncbi:hypothetical protein B7P43_G09490, partial [Cryptotermes secundus]
CASLTPVSGLRLGTDPIGDAILLGLDGARDDGPMVKKSDPQVYGMWFGPRLGRRERRSVDEILDDAGDGRVEEVLQLLKETPWVLVPLKGNKRQTGSFIPRLGRDSKEEEEDPDAMEQRSPPFAPRLGRRLVPFRPRMGRDRLPYDVYSPRLGRSVQPSQPQGKKEAPQH